MNRDITSTSSTTRRQYVGRGTGMRHVLTAAWNGGYADDGLLTSFAAKAIQH
jgi:hypothetical protein